MQKLEDISSFEEYRSIIGKQYQTRDALLLYGVTDDPNYAKVVDRYVLTSPPGFGGPEVVSQGTLPAGTRIVVVKALRCSNCLFGAPVALEVTVRTLPTQGQRIFLYGLRESSGKHVTLDPKWFKELADDKKEPNQPPEPTALSVTPRADARVAPASTVAHL